MQGANHRALTIGTTAPATGIAHARNVERSAQQRRAVRPLQLTASRTLNVLVRMRALLLMGALVLTLGFILATRNPHHGVYTFAVNTSQATHDLTPGDGRCDDVTGHCSLRAALEEAKALPASSGSAIRLRMPTGEYAVKLGQRGSFRSAALAGAWQTRTLPNGVSQLSRILAARVDRPGLPANHALARIPLHPRTAASRHA